LIEKNKIMNRIDKLKEFLQATPKDSFLQHALALEYIKEDNDIEAKNLFEAILKREPNYVGSYYHLGKLLERNNNFAEAINIYKNGMVEAKASKDNHSYNELMGALEDLEDN
jgi:predicted Zn-dependent protease